MEQEEVILHKVKLEMEYCGEHIQLEERSLHSEEQDEQELVYVKNEESDENINIKLEELSSHSEEQEVVFGKKEESGDDINIQLEKQIWLSEVHDGQGLVTVKQEGSEEEAVPAQELRQVARYYCCVAGCAGVSETNVPSYQRLFMFSLPTEAERRLQWLRLIDREDLLQSRVAHHVCEEHFYCTSVVGSGAGKRLQPTAIPILKLPAGPDVLGAGSLAWRGRQHAWVQAGPRLNTQYVQTTVDLQRHVPLVKTLKNQIALLQKEKRRHCSATQELKLLGELIDKHMGRRFAEVAHLHLRNRQVSRGNRYSEAYKRYCLRLYEASPQVFEQLRELRVLPLPKYVVQMKAKVRAAAQGAGAGMGPASGEQEWQDEPASAGDEATSSDGSASCDIEQDPLATEAMSV